MFELQGEILKLGIVSMPFALQKRESAAKKPSDLPSALEKQAMLKAKIGKH